MTKKGYKKGFSIKESTLMYGNKKVITIAYNGRTRGGWITDTPKNRELLKKVIERKQKGELH